MEVSLESLGKDFKFLVSWFFCSIIIVFNFVLRFRLGLVETIVVLSERELGFRYLNIVSLRLLEE